MIAHLHRATRLLLFITLVLAALGLSVARLIVSAVPHYQAELTEFASQTLGAPVTIKQIKTGFRGLTPEILIDNISLTDAHTTTTAIKLDDVHISVDLFALVRSQALMPALGLTIKGIKLTLERSADGSIHVHGLPASEGNPNWLFNIGRFSVSDSEIAFIETSKASHVLSLNHADLLLSNDNNQHHLDIQTTLNPSYGNALRISAQLTGNPFAANELSGLIYLDAKALNLAQWLKEQLPASLALNKGLADIQLWGRLSEAHLQQIAVISRLQDIALQQGNNQPLNLNRIYVTSQWQQLKNLPAPAWQLTVNQLAITPNHTQHPLKPISFSVTVQNPDIQAKPIISGQIKQIDLAALTQLIQPLDLATLAPELNALKQSQLQGQLNNLGFYIDPNQQRYTVKGKFNQLGINHPDFSVQTISGEINGNQHQGQLTLNGKYSVITSPKHLREPLTLTQLNATLNWQRQADGLALNGAAIQLDLPGLTTSTRFQLQIPDDPQAAIFTDWLTELSADDVSQLRHYYPALDMDSEDVAWLDRAFVSGQISHGRLSYYGPLNKTIDLGHEPATQINNVLQPDLTPEQDANAQVISSEMVGDGGVFQAHLKIENLTLIYAPDWPQLTEVNGELNFTQRRMEIHASHGHSLGLTASNTVVINEAVGRGKDLAITGQVNGSVANSLNFLQHSPLNDYVGGLIKAIEPEGDTVVDLALNVPMLSEKDPTVLGSAQFNNNRLWIKSIQLPIQRIIGQLKFNEQGIYSDNLKAVVFDKPANVTIDNKAHSTVINATGAADIAAIDKHFRLPFDRFAQGHFNYQLRLNLPDDRLSQATSSSLTADNRYELLIDSDLTGLNLKLPGVLKKDYLTPKNLHLVFNLDQANQLPIQIDYAKQLAAYLRVNTDNRAITAGHIRIGDELTLKPAETGVKLDIMLPKLDLQEWLGFAGGDSDEQLLTQLSLYSPHARFASTALDDFRIDLQFKQNHWQGEITSALAKGQISVPQKLNTKAISFTLKELNLSAPHAIESKTTNAIVLTPTTDANPKDLPLFKLTSSKTLWQGVDLGMLALDTEYIDNGIRFKDLTLNSVAAQLALKADWLTQNQTTQTQLKGDITLHNAGSLLTQLGVPNDLVETGLQATVKLNWPGSPTDFAIAQAQGDIGIEFDDGRILSIEPGFGRILGVLAMAQWQKRMQLDFRDIYEQGLSFNSIKGHLTLSSGQAYINDLIVDAIPAKINLLGHADLRSKTVELTAKIAPKGADALPIAGTIVDKVTGIVAFGLTGENTEGFLLGSEYKIQGPWNQLHVIPVHENDGLLQKTWTGLKTFPWIQQ